MCVYKMLHIYIYINIYIHIYKHVYPYVYINKINKIGLSHKCINMSNIKSIREGVCFYDSEGRCNKEVFLRPGTSVCQFLCAQFLIFWNEDETLDLNHKAVKDAGVNLFQAEYLETSAKSAAGYLSGLGNHQNKYSSSVFQILWISCRVQKNL